MLPAILCTNINVLTQATETTLAATMIPTAVPKADPGEGEIDHEHIQH